MGGEEGAARHHQPTLRKFPRTRHLVNLGSATRDDLLFDPAEVKEFLSRPVVVEEKVDGANVGISVVDGQLVVQNRSHFVNEETSEQFRPLGEWLRAHSAELWTIFEAHPRYVLYGEWLHVKHSIHYTRLPDRFMLFDILDGATGKFLDAAAIAALIGDTTLVRTRVMFQGRTTLKDLVALASTAKSDFYDGPVEGIYVRTEEAGWVVQRGKIVRADFLEAHGPDGEVVHWTAGKLVKNTVVPRA
jgi:atypical dual specificity phosphatase